MLLPTVRVIALTLAPGTRRRSCTCYTLAVDSHTRLRDYCLLRSVRPAQRLCFYRIQVGEKVHDAGGIVPVDEVFGSIAVKFVLGIIHFTKVGVKSYYTPKSGVAHAHLENWRLI